MPARHELAAVVEEMRKFGVLRADFNDEGAIKALILGPEPPPVPEKPADERKEDPLVRWEREQERVRQVALRAVGGVRSPVK